MSILAFVRVPIPALQSFTFVRWLAATRAIGAALLTIGLSNWAAAQTTTTSNPLTLESALSKAETRSHALEAQDSAAKSAREMAIAAGRLPDPILRLSVDSLPIDGPMRLSLTDDFMTMRSVGLTQTLTREDKRRARSARFEREGDVARSMRTVQLIELRRQTALAWFDLYYQQKMVDLLTRQRDETALQIQAAKAAYRSGRGAQADVFMAQSAVARMDDRIQEARSRAVNARTSLARWVGEVVSAPLGIAPTITRSRLSERTLKDQLDQHPEIALLTSKESVALAEVEVARQDKSADWSVSLMYSRRGSAFSDMVSVGVSIPLQWDQKNRQIRELTAKLEKVEQTRAERAEVARALLAQTRRRLATWQSNLMRLDQYDKTLIVFASERTRVALAAYRGGKAPLSGVLDARWAEIDTRAERLRIEMETAALWAALEYLIPDLPEPAVSSITSVDAVEE